ncbi:MAG: extracellular solute-binding protein [Acidimicrobiia bacterium]|nr:extracellular solute-binding protein [Acidimicrobiia bacterium]
MQYRVLGKFEVSRDGVPVDVGSYRQKSLLAFLLTTPNKVISTDRIIDALWGDETASDRQNALWVHISGLRKALEPEREKRSEGTILLTRAPGYLVQVEPHEVDALQFERLAAEGRALADTDPAAASLVLGEALALWQGRAYEDFTYEAFAAAEIARLEELRLATVEDRIDADLQRGMSRELVSELESLIRQYPLRERLTGQAMLALYRSGRQAEALRLYQFLKSRLGEELGIEPSSRISRLEEQIVTGDPALEAASTLQLPGSGPEPGLAVRGYELREQLGEGGSGVVYRAYQPVMGREVAIKVIRPELANDPVFIRRFEAEAQLVARLEHPHIVPLYDYWREPDAAYLAMQLMGRGSLRDVIEDTALTHDAAARVVEQISGALATAHRAGVAHGDIKPENILIDGAGNAFLSDFAIAIDARQRVGTGGPDRTLQAPYASPEQLSDGAASPVGDIHSLGAVMAQALTGLDAAPAQIRGALPPAVARVIDKATDPDPASRYEDVAAFASDLLKELVGDEQPARLAEVGDVENPYRGLRPFEQTDADQFYGRERLVERLLAHLGEKGSRGRFVAVVGPSGSGKSSVVKAGLLPALRKGALPASDEWFVVDMTPAPHPFEELEGAMRRIAVDPPPTLLEQLAGNDAGLRRIVRQVLPEGSQLLLVVDQFEELFTQVDEDTADRFLDALVDAVTNAHSNIRVVATLRADFYDRPLRHRGLGELLREGTEVITPMSPEELEQAITRPAHSVGVMFEPALVAQLVTDVAERPGALPLLQYTLTELFEGRTSPTIPLGDYHSLGGVSGALVSRADGLLAGLSPTAADAAREVLLRLVTLGEGAEDTRRRVLVAELRQLAVASQDLDRVLDTFGRHRLLSFDRDPVTRGPTVEISHEALLTQWIRLRDWVDEARHDVRNQRRLAQAMNEWDAAGRSADYLLRGGQLDQLAGWAAVTSLPLSDPESEFLTASIVERERAASEQREQEERTTEAERRARQRLRLLSVVGIAAVVVAVLAVFAFVQRQAARDSEAETQVALDRAVVAEGEARVAEEEAARLLRASTLATKANLNLDANPELSLLLAVEAARTTADWGFVTPEAVDALHWALQVNQLVYPATGETNVAVRPGPLGTVGVFALEPDRLAELASSAAGRSFTADECAQYFPDNPCPDSSQPLSAGLSILGGEQAYGVVPNAPGALEGTSMTLAGSWAEMEGLSNELEHFEQVTSIDIGYEDRSATPGWLGKNVGAGKRLPELAQMPQPGAVAYAALQGWLIDLTSYVTPERVADVSGTFLASLVRIGDNGQWPDPSGSVYSIPVDIDVKGLVYYPRAKFEEAGYRVPETWNELMALSEQMVVDGHTPWCVAFQSPGGASGWPGTDWLESLLIRAGGIDIYQQWTLHQIPFDDPAIVAAASMFDAVVGGEGFVRGGRGLISQLNWGVEVVDPLLKDEPQCWLALRSDYLLGFMPAGTEIGVDVDFFELPPTEAGVAVPATGGGSFIGATVDRPEVRAFIEHALTAEWGEAWAAAADSEFISPNLEFDVDHYGADVTESERRVRRALGSLARDRLAADLWRFDASDLMPPAIGSATPAGRGAFWQGMLDYVDGLRTMDQVLSDIEAAWVALEEEAAEEAGGT